MSGRNCRLRSSRSARIRNGSRALAVAGVLLLPLASATALAQEPDVDPIVAVFTHDELPPATLDLAWQAVPIIVRARVQYPQSAQPTRSVAIIVRARVQSSAVREIAGPRPGYGVPLTEHRVKLLEIFKGAELLGTARELHVAQESVEAGASPNGVVHKSGGPVFKASEEYVLFLRPFHPALRIVWGPGGGAYKVGADTVAVPALALRMWQFQDEVPREAFFNTLRMKRDKPRGK